MSRIGKQPIAIPSGVEVARRRGNVVTVKGPRGSLEQRHPPGHARSCIDDGDARVERPDDERLQPRAARLTRSLLANMVDGRHEGLREAAGDRRRRLPRRAQGQATSRCGRLLAPGARAPPGRHRVRGARARPGRRSAATTSSWSGEVAAEHPQDPQARAVQGQGHPLRGRVRAQEGRQGREGRLPDGCQDEARGPAASPRACPQEGRAAGRRPRLAVFRSNRHIYAQLIDDRQATHDGGGLRRRDRRAGRQAPTERAKAVGELLATRAKDAGIDTRRCSTAAGVSTTGASPRSPTEPARPDCRSERR